ncbi:MAG: endonuclease/exonuclease/phosphatase family protein [Muribaculaceae bacterium]|nr:endonuclease/exonuclease/phosphatase family protein [Muribaculaceae bacterium]
MSIDSKNIGKKGLKMGKNTVKVILLCITVLMALLLVASAWGGYVNPTKFSFLSVLTLGLPLILIINFVIMITWLVVLQWRYALISLAAILLSWGSVRMVFPINLFSSSTEATPENSLRVLTFNVMNFGPYDPSNHIPSKSMRYTLDQNADVVLLQEGSQERNYLKLSNVEMMSEELENKYPYHSDGRHDLMILSKYPYTVINDTILKTGPENVKSRDPEYQYYARGYDLELPNGKQLRIVNLHLHTIGLDDGDRELYMNITKNNIDSEEEFRKIKSSLYNKLCATFKYHAHEAQMVRNFLDKSPGNVIVCGDFNDTPASYSYRTVRGDDMRDAFMDCGFGFKHTFHDNRLYFKIDHIMYRGDLEAVDWYRDKAGDSDHYPQVATFVWK